MAKDTKQKLMDAALDIFIRDGYDGANIKDICAEVGIVKSAFYRHFDSKDALWNEMIEQIATHYNRHFNSRKNAIQIPSSLEQFKETALAMFGFTLDDEKVIKARKLLTKEQFSDEKAKQLANYYFCEKQESIFAVIFSGMMEKGLIKQCDVGLLAFGFSAPLSELVHYSDRNPEKREEVLKKAAEFTDMFLKEYGVK